MSEIKDLDFHYAGVEVHYDWCHCGKIDNIEIEDIDLHTIMWNICNNLELDTELDRYCIDRIIRKSELYVKYNWNVEVEQDYYGDCIGNISPAYDDFYSNVNDYLKCTSDIEKIEFILDMDYEFLLDKVKDKRWSIVEVELSDIIIPNQPYMSEIEVEEWYEVNELPVCLCVKRGNKFELVDGYHRLKNLKDKSKIKILMGE